MKARLPNDIEAMLARLEPLIRQAFLDAVASITSAAQLQVIVGHLRDGNVEMALAALKIDPAFFAPLDRAIGEAYYQGGVMALAALPAIPDPFSGGRVVLGFNGRHPRAERWVKEHSGTLIEGIVQDQMDAARTVMNAGLVAGRNPTATALDIVGRMDKATGRRTGGIMGLNSQQAQWVTNARAELLSGDPARMAGYLTRERRDKRFDSVVRAAIRDGKPVSAPDVERLTARYSDRLLKLRGDTIARTESITALRAGRHEGYSQLMDTGAVRQDQIERTWDATGDARTRPSHMALDGQKVTGMEEPFRAPDGSLLMYPGDTSLGASAEETIQCRCFESVRVRYL